MVQKVLSAQRAVLITLKGCSNRSRAAVLTVGTVGTLELFNIRKLKFAYPPLLWIQVIATITYVLHKAQWHTLIGH